MPLVGNGAICQTAKCFISPESWGWSPASLGTGVRPCSRGAQLVAAVGRGAHAGLPHALPCQDVQQQLGKDGGGEENSQWCPRPWRHRKAMQHGYLSLPNASSWHQCVCSVNDLFSCCSLPQALLATGVTRGVFAARARQPRTAMVTEVRGFAWHSLGCASPA